MSDEVTGSQMPDHNVSVPDASTAEVIVDARPQSGTFNMAMDSVLLDLAAERDHSVIRIYEWAVPTVTLGYFQGNSSSANPDDSFSSKAAELKNLPTVKRLSGGGAILHDREITYCCVLPATHSIRQNPSSLYEIVHLALIRLLADCGISCLLRSQFDEHASGLNSTPSSTTPPEASSEPFLCFLRRNPNDIVHESGHKVVGSAQRRRKGVTLQHGSILLSESSLAPGIPGILNLSAQFGEHRFRQQLPECIASAIASSWTFRQYDPAELQQTSELLNRSAEP